MSAAEERRLVPVPLTRRRFSPYGDVIETGRGRSVAMNDARFDRYDGLCSIDVGDGELAVGITVSRSATRLPYRIDRVERHPHGTQAFVPLSVARMIVVVAPPGEAVDPEELVAFETNGRQGINYACGTWHMPLIALEAGQRFLVIDRGGETPNCDEYMLDDPVVLTGD